MTSTVDLTGEQTGSKRFAAALRDATKGVHQTAAMSSYMGELVEGRLTRAQYAELVAQHYFAYVELEAASERMRNDAVAGRFVFDELTRVPSLEADLQFLLGDEWRDRIAPSAATSLYCDRIREVGNTWPGGFVAHHYTRYLGDLSGGQFVGAAVARAFGLESGDGVRFYRFDEIDDPVAFKDAYRALLDQSPWEAAEEPHVIAEVLVAYRHNTDVLSALDRSIQQPVP